MKISVDGNKQAAESFGKNTFCNNEGWTPHCYPFNDMILTINSFQSKFDFV